MTIKKKLNFGAILLEASFVVLGVVLAFSINQCRENRSEEERAAHALETIRQEISKNRALVAENFEYHSYLMDTLKTYRRPEAGLPSMQVFHRGFISQGQPLSTAWETALVTDALKETDYDRLIQLSEVYHLQEKYAFQFRETGGNIYEILLKEGPEAILENTSNLSTTIGTFRYRERQLIQAYDQLLSELNDAEDKLE